MSKSTPSNIPGVNMMTDTFDFFKNMWGSVPGMNVPGMNLPGMVMPTLSVDEIDKQIKDLKAVESWLSLNMNMLQGTIQALEVQKATLSTLQTMGESFSAAMQPPNMSTASDKQAFESPFAASAAKPASAGITAAKATPPEKPAPDESPAAGFAGGEQAGAIPPLANPAAWWGMLQDQFKQAVDTAAAMTPEAPAAVPAKPVSTPAKSAKPAAASSAPRKRKSPPKA